MYRYKLTEQDKNLNQFQTDRITTFDTLESRLEDIKKLIRLGKIETIKYYRDNPTSYSVVIGTDLIGSYLDDIEDLLKPTT
jgi:hypothetical protein